jgi:hypothetical protein
MQNNGESFQIMKYMIRKFGAISFRNLESKVGHVVFDM